MVYKTPNIADTTKINAVYKLGVIYYNSGNDSLALAYANCALITAKKCNYTKGIAKAYYLLGMEYTFKGKHDKAIAILLAGIKLCKANNYTQLYFLTTTSLGTTYVAQGNYRQALSYINEALKTSQILDDKRGVGACLTTLGKIYLAINEPNKALGLFNKALTIYIAQHDTTGIIGSQINTSAVYIKQLKYEAALRINNKGLQAALRINDTYNIALFYGNNGIIYSELGNAKAANKTYNYTTAHNYYTKALTLNLALADSESIANTLLNIGTLYNYQKQYTKSLYSLTQSLRIAQQNNYTEITQYCYKLMYEAYEQKKEYAEALKYYKLYVTLKDSAFTIESTRQLSDLKTDYEVANKERELTEQAYAQQQQRVIWYWIIGVLLLIVVFAIVLVYNKKQSLRALAEKDLRQKLLLSQMNPHFIFNSINTIQSLIRSNDNERAINYLDGFSALTRQILEHSRETYITLADELSVINNYLHIQQLLGNNAFSYTIIVASNIDTTTLLVPPMLTQPFIENAIKHGVTNTHGQVSVCFALTNQLLMATITDNGTGFNSTNTPANHKPLAIKITQERLSYYTHQQQTPIRFENITNATQQIIGAKVEVQIPYLIDN